MKVTDITSQLSTEYKLENKKTRPDQEEQQQIDKRSGDKVEISSRSRDIQKMEEMVKAAPEERTELVQSLKQKVESGEYKVDSREVAGKMLTDSLEEQSLLS
ncbi:MAG: flagellar biosynthesis anti-sigma factor FlgM [Desulfurivibrionaceae bacterium]